MSKKVKAVILSVSIAIVLFTIAGGLGVRAASNDGAYRQLGVYSEVLSRIRSEYVEEPNIPQVTDGALHGLLESLDPNSSYLTPAEYKKYRSRKGDARGQIGAAISKRFGYAAVISVIPGGPADKAGIESGDIFEAIEGRTTREMSLVEVQSLLAGEPGSNVNVSVVRARRAEPQKVTITRNLVTIPPVTDKSLEDGIIYIKVDAFNKGKAQEISNKLKADQQKGAKKIILDLRDCAEGDMQEGIATANLFLNHGVITSLQGQRYPRETFNADLNQVVTGLPLVVMVNRGTAGPAEVAAAAILENARGDVLGDKTFGVGSVQKVIEIPDGSALILSVAKYYTPNGKAIQDTAITPNILVADNNDDFVLPDDEDNPAPPDQAKKQRTLQNDEQLKRAIEVLKSHDAKVASAGK
ncbi:MAG: PDZ domain-containing protein [Acidobacteriia bacterium]|nr:PDZ domain-containing protein [Terriglobia bacterium]